MKTFACRVLMLGCLFTVVASGATFTVNTTADEFNTPSGANLSLREALRDTAAAAGVDTIVFAAAMSGATITLGSEIAITDTPSGVIIDAGSLGAGLTLDGGPGTNRIFTINAGRDVTVRNITFTGGNGSGGSVIGAGGAIDNLGTLTLIRCHFTNNSASGSGGAVRNGTGSGAAMLTATECSFSNNTSGYGGAIANRATLTMRNCTLTANVGTVAAGAIDNDVSKQATLIHCTISGNSAPTGGGIDNLGTLILVNSIVAGNTLSAAGSGPDIFNEPGATLTREGVNLMSVAAVGSGTVGGPGSILVADPRLAPIAQAGGPTRCMPLLPGSPAMDAAAVLIPSLSVDQRGLPRTRDGDGIPGALPDIGAYEAQVMPFALGLNLQDASVSGGDALAATDRAGAPGFVQGFWNGLSGSNSGLSADTTARQDAGGTTVPGLKLWWRGPNTWRLAGTADTPDKKLMFGYLDSNGSGDGSAVTDLYNTSAAHPYVALASLPAALTAGGYKVVVYTDIAVTDGRIARYWLTSNRAQDPSSVGGETALTGSFFTRDTSDFAGNYTRATATTDTGATTPGGNYVVFENIAEPGGFIVRAEEGSLPGGSAGRAPINAVQVVRNETLIVTTAVDENDPNGTLGLGISLREAVRDAPDGGGIVFDPDVFSNTAIPIVLSSEIVIAKNVTIDASNFPSLTIDGGAGTNRIFTVQAGASVSLLGLTLTGGNGTGLVNGVGGAVDNSGSVRLIRCTLHHNSCSGAGGALRNATATSTMDLQECTLSDNSAAYGGAISNFGILTLRQCNLSANTATSGSGAIDNNPGQQLRLIDCILSGNSAPTGGAVENLGTLALERSLLTGNMATGSGGAVKNNSGATLTLTDSILATNTSGSQGGSIQNQGTLIAERCLFSGNIVNSTNGGAVANDNGTANFTSCTFYGNAKNGSTQGGGAINHASSASSMTLTHCTIAGNSSSGSDGGGGIRNRGPAMTINYGIVAGNTISAGSGADLNSTQTIVRGGANIIRTTAGTGTFSGPIALTSDPLLAPLYSYGGPSLTMALRPGSPARNAATGSTITTDQRGYPMVGTPDLGAYEAGTLDNCPAYLAETLPATATNAQIAPTYDFDGDGTTNEQEWAALTNPASAASVFRITSAVKSGANVDITFPTVATKTYTLWQSDTLSGIWTNTGQTAISGDGSAKSFVVPAPVNGVPKRFHRVQVGP